MEFQEVGIPSTRPCYETSSLAKEGKERILEADPNGGRCLVTNAKNALNYCHCIAKIHMKNKDLVCEISTIFILELNIYYSSIASNGPGT